MTDKIFEINGYILNNSNQAFFKIQRAIPPGGKVSFENVFKTLGKKSGLTGKSFLSWLKEKHFAEPEWLFFNADGSRYLLDNNSQPATTQAQTEPATSAPKEQASAPSFENTEEVAPARGAGKNLRRTTKNQVKKGTEITPASIIEADYNKAQAMIDACRDKLVLKKALNLSKHFANKEHHMRQILKRLEQVV